MFSLLSAAILIQPASVIVGAAQTPGSPTLAAQTSDTGIPLAPLPAPVLPDGSKPSAYLRAAEAALATGRLGEAQSALEMAQTRMLDRSVPLGRTNDPSANPMVGQIAQALQALAAKDRSTCMQLIQAALASATAQGL
jgi:hypothetical protein